MKYMLLIYSDENAWTDAERQDCYVESTELTHELNARRQYLGANPLHPVAMAASVRVREGKRLVTDGPFAETREQLGGYFLVEANDLNEAISIASRIPAARKGTVEVRPVMELAGLPTPAHYESALEAHR
ncbi:MAG: YciI family protein [Pirellulales bacterium]